MHWRPSLHPPVLTTQAHKERFASEASLIAKQRSREQLIAKEGRFGKRAEAFRAAVSPSLSIPLTTVSMAGSFDAYVNISFPGASGVLSAPLLVDSGNNSLILPDYSEIAALPGFAKNYEVLEYDIQEPWGCPACKLRGPILLPIDANDFHRIDNCVFYACTGPNENNERTANFGTGCLAPRRLGTADIQSPLAVSTDYPFAEFNYAPAVQIFEPGAGPITVGNSFLTLYTEIPAGYQMYDIIPGQYWMSLRPKALAVGGVATSWPGDLAPTCLAVVDTGGGPVFLSDPNNALWRGDWASPAVLPEWVGGSSCCQATSANLAITLTDAKGKEFSYNVDTTKLPASVQGLTLVMCKLCSYMGAHQDGTPQDGMNIGGVAALFNYILIDYAAARLGFKAKPAELA